jgi:hypothetical protein
LLGFSAPRATYLDNALLVSPTGIASTCLGRKEAESHQSKVVQPTLTSLPLSFSSSTVPANPVVSFKKPSTQWESPRPRTVIVLGLIGASMGALTGLLFKKPLLGEAKMAAKLLAQVTKLASASSGGTEQAVTHKPTEVSTYVNEMSALLMATPNIYPELTQAVLLYGVLMGVGFLGANLLDGLQEAWVRWEESAIRAQLLTHMQGSFQQGISTKLSNDVDLKTMAKNQLLHLLIANGIEQPERYLSSLGVTRFKGSQAVGEFLFVPTKANLEASATPLLEVSSNQTTTTTTKATMPRTDLNDELAAGWLTTVSSRMTEAPNHRTPTGMGMNQPNSLQQDPPPAGWLVNGIALLAGMGVGLFGAYAGYSLKQSADKALALKWMKTLHDATVKNLPENLLAIRAQIDKVRPYNKALDVLMTHYGNSPETLKGLESLGVIESKTFLNFNNYLGLTVAAIKQGEWAKVVSLLALGMLLGVGNALVVGIREIEVTRLNAKTELSYQQYRLEALEPLYRRLNDEAELGQALAQLQLDLPCLKQQPEALERRCQAIVNNVGLTPAWISMSPAVQLTMARG